MQVMVVVAQSDRFYFVHPDDHHSVEEPLPGPSVQRLLVESQSGATVLVPVRPLLLGLMPVSVKIQSIAGAQRLQRTVLVKVRQRGGKSKRWVVEKENESERKKERQ